MEKREILHIDLDSFYVSVERLRKPELIGVPLVICGSSDRAVISSCSYEARQLGFHSAMPMKEIKRNPHRDKIVMVKPNMQEYTHQSEIVAQIIKAAAPPMVEQASIDEFYVDISGFEKYVGSYAWACALADRITCETGLPISFGLSVNKTVAKIATSQSKPRGRLHVPATKVQEFLNPLPISAIPMLGPETDKKLQRTGIIVIEQLAQTPVEILQALLGETIGIDLWKKANGIDNSPVEPHRERKSLSRSQTFEKDTEDVKTIKALFVSMVEDLAFGMRKEKWLTSKVCVTIRYNNFDTETVNGKVDYTSDDEVLIDKTHELFDKLFKRRMLIRLVGVKFTNLVRGTYQVDMFSDTAKKIALNIAKDKIKNRFGANAIKLGGGMEHKLRK